MGGRMWRNTLGWPSHSSKLRVISFHGAICIWFQYLQPCQSTYIIQLSVYLIHTLHITEKEGGKFLQHRHAQGRNTWTGHQGRESGQLAYQDMSRVATPSTEKETCWICWSFYVQFQIKSWKLSARLNYKARREISICAFQILIRCAASSSELWVPPQD